MTTAPTPQPEALRLADELMEPTLWPNDIRNLGADMLRRLQAENERPRAAERTLQRLGYQDRGGHEWAPPIGKAPDFDLIDNLRARIAELEARKPLPLSDEQLRAEFIPWAEIQYRHEDEFSKRDFKICLAAWSAGRRITGGSS